MIILTYLLTYFQLDFPARGGCTRPSGRSTSRYANSRLLSFVLSAVHAQTCTPPSTPTHITQTPTKCAPRARAQHIDRTIHTHHTHAHHTNTHQTHTHFARGCAHRAIPIPLPTNQPTNRPRRTTLPPNQPTNQPTNIRPPYLSLPQSREDAEAAAAKRRKKRR